VTRLFLRAYVQVALVSVNVAMIAASNWAGAYVTSFCLSWVWWGNARSAAHQGGRWARTVYALGAACGTVSGMLVGRLVGAGNH
jgi:hypothetical protein